MLTLALALVLEHAVGLGALRANNARWLAEPGWYVLPRTALFVAECLWRWVGLPVLLLAAIGCVRFARRRSRADLLWLCWGALFLAALPLYTNYPRLLVPLLGAAFAFAAGAGAEWLASRARARAVLAYVALALFAHGVARARNPRAAHRRLRRCGRLAAPRGRR